MLRYNLRKYIIYRSYNYQQENTKNRKTNFFSELQNAKIITGISILYTWLVYIVNMVKLIKCLYICCCFTLSFCFPYLNFFIMAGRLKS